ncbi:hypothetical protein M3Y99_01680600 [Aphelenchoides fujianensis]|nr:hypothetical protein M3Y99_01680600 [Aphelenchoides fujianensis]
MSSEGPPVKSAKSKSSSKSGGSASKPQHTHPDYTTMLIEVLELTQQPRTRKGVSVQQIVKTMMERFDLGEDEKHVRTVLKRTLPAAVEKDLIHVTSGKGGLTGSYRLVAKNKKKSGHESASATPSAKKKAASTPKTKKPAAKEAAPKKSATPKQASRLKAVLFLTFFFAMLPAVKAHGAPHGRSTVEASRLERLWNSGLPAFAAAVFLISVLIVLCCCLLDARYLRTLRARDQAKRRQKRGNRRGSRADVEMQERMPAVEKPVWRRHSSVALNGE